jgi:hypothetical protein
MSVGSAEIAFLDSAQSPILRTDGLPARALAIYNELMDSMVKLRERTCWNYFYSPPRLCRWGEGHFLVDDETATAIANVQQNNRSPIHVRFADELTAPGTLWSGIVTIRCVVKNFRLVVDSGAGNRLWDMEVADERYVLRNVLCANTQVYNITDAGATDDPALAMRYHTSTLNGGTPWTWQQILTALFAMIPSSFNFHSGNATVLPTGSTFPTTAPEDFNFSNLPVGVAMDMLAEAVGLFYVFRPYIDDGQTGPKLVSAKSGATGTEAWNTNAIVVARPYNESGDLRSAPFPAGLSPIEIPGTIRVCFPRKWLWGETEWRTDQSSALPALPYYAVNAADSVRDGIMSSGDEYDTRQTLAVYDHRWAIYQRDSATCQNSAALQTRADEIGASVWRNMFYSVRGRRVDRGIFRYQPSGWAQALMWQNGADGLYTVVNADPNFNNPMMEMYEHPQNRIRGIGGVTVLHTPGGHTTIHAAIPKHVWVDEPTTLCPDDCV